MSQGVLLGIAIRERSGAPMVPLEEAEISVESGVVGDFRGRPGSRQVTVLAREAWEAACCDLNQELSWMTRRANLLIEGIDLESTTGARIQIGAVELEVCGETDPCHRMDEQVDGLMSALGPNWRGGVCCRVIAGGTVKIGEPVRFSPSR